MSQLGEMTLQDDNHCFACGKENPHGIQMQVEYSQNQAICRLALPPRFQGWAGIAHGGVVATLCDEIMAHAVLHFLGLGMTATMETRFKKPVPIGEELLVQGWVAQHRGRLAEAAATIKLASNEEVLAESQAKFLLQA
jgi:acyl-coenzyme A thioesterase PaaI-like protein